MKRLDTMNIIQQLEAEQAQAIEAKRQLPAFSPGDTVRVLVRVTEGTRTRVQAYEGVCIARKGARSKRKLYRSQNFLWRRR